MVHRLPVDDDLVLGIDLGIASCGWGVLSFRSAPHIKLLGARCFALPEQPKTKELNNAVRRRYRAMRRVVHRRRMRLTLIRQLLRENGLPDGLAPEVSTDRPGPWRSRAEGLGRKLEPEEFAAVLIHCAKHRGFKSNRKTDRGRNAPDENKKMLGGVDTIRELSAGYETLGQMMHRDPKFATKKRNSEGDYSHTVPRDLLEAEIGKIFERQRRFGNDAANDEIEAIYRKIAFSQRPLANSEHMVGSCPFEPGERRAARQSYSFELFRYLSRLNALKIKTPGGEVRRLTADEIHSAAMDFGKQKTISYKSLRRMLPLRLDDAFEGVKPEAEAKDVSAADGSASGTHILRSAIGEAGWRSLLDDTETLDAIAFVLAFRDDIDSIRQGLDELRLPQLVRATIMLAVENGNFGGFKRAGHISAKAARCLIPFLQMKNVYSKACELAGYPHSERPNVALEDIRNPVVLRTLREALRQIRNVLHELGARPGAIHIELAREIGKNAEERDNIKSGLDQRTSDREKHRKDYLDLTQRETCSDEDLLRYELWLEQGGKCIYTDDYISPLDIACDRNAIQIDHVLPRSRSQDNSYGNKVLCTTTANQEKKNCTPFEWKQGDEAWWFAFTTRVEMLKIKGIKKRNLLMKDFASHQENFVKRNLQDTRYASRALLAELKKFYAEADGPDRRVYARPGSITAMLRRAWGLESVKKNATGERSPDDRHHALDAVIIAATSESVLQNLTRLYQAQELDARYGYTPSVEAPWKGFRQEILQALETVHVSRSERRRGRGQGHDATIRQIREEGGERIIYEKKTVGKLTRADLPRIKDPERNKALVERLAAWLDCGKPKDDPPRSPKGDVVRKVRLRMGVKAGTTVRKGHADNADMVRTDVFRKAGKFYLVPIYTHQVANKVAYPAPPNRGIVAYEDEDGWARIDGSFEFRFSLYPNSYIEIVKQDGEVIEGYYRSTNRSTGAIGISPANRHDDEALRSGIGARTLASFKKFNIDRLGRKHEILSETQTWHGAVCT